MPSLTASIRTLVVGWMIVPLFGVAVLISKGADEAPYVVGTSVIAIGLALWAWTRQCRAALFTSLAVGFLLVLQQLGYVVAGATSSPVDTTVLIQDLVGLGGGALVVVGSVGGLVNLRGARRTAATPA